jgi:peptidoglycan LD-endopeptidase LytH
MPAVIRARVRGRALPVVAVVAAIATAGLLLPPFAADAGDYERAKERKEALEAELEDVTARLDDLRARIDTTRDDIEALEEEAEELEVEAAELEESLNDRARSTFKRGAGDVLPFQSLFTASDPSEAVERAGLVATLSRGDVAALERATALRVRLDQTRELLAARSAELDGLEDELDQRGDELDQRLQAAASEYRELRTIRDRQRQISRGAQQGTYACIFQGAYHFRDTWGAPRSGGRRHRGTDVMAPYRQPVYAFTDGRISRMSRSGLGGIGLYIRGDDGNQYYYAHLDAYADGIHVGRRVQAGEHVAYNGYTGNASPSAPHVHFEVHPGGGGAVNPYPWLRAAC